MKRYLIYVLALPIALSALSCAKEIPAEKPFIETGNGSDDTAEGNPYWDWADKYPGVVSSLIERTYGVEVQVKGGYEPFAFAPDTTVLQSTGLYAAGGEKITITVPDGVSGLEYQIGLGYKLLPGQLRRRYDDVVTRGPLSPGENTVKNYFGGYIYLGYAPENVPAGDITVTISGAVESDDYIMGVTDKSAWLERMQARAALVANPVESADSMAFLRWTELRSDKLILTAGVKEMSSMKDPEKVLEAYGNIVDAYYAFAGLDPTNQPPMRVYTDIQLPDAEQTAQSSNAKIDRYGQYPIAYRRGLTDANIYWEDKIININYLQGQKDPDLGSSFIKHFLAFGDAVQSNWQKSDLMNWPVNKMAQRYYVSKSGLALDSEIDFYTIVRDLNKDYARTSDARYMYINKDETVRSAMFMQLAQKYGWNLFPYVSKRCRELKFDYTPDSIIADQEANDFFVMCASEYAGKNLYPFFQLWSFPCSQFAIEYMRKFPDYTEDEIFWKSYDPSVYPSFEERSVQAYDHPEGHLKYTMPDADVQNNWFMDGMLLDINKYNATPPKTVYKRQANSLFNTDWKKAFDGDIARGIQVLGHCQNATNDTYANIPICYLSFVGPKGLEDIAVGGLITYTTKKPANTNLSDIKIWIPATTDLTQYSDTPLTFNTMNFVNSNQYYMTSFFYDIEYWDLEEKAWKPTKPAEFKLLYTHVYETYYFEETYTTTRIRYKMQPITPGTSGYSICEYNEVNFGLVELDGSQSDSGGSVTE